MSHNTTSLTERLEAERQRVKAERPGYVVWWLYGSNSRITWHARPEGVNVVIPVSADSADDLIKKLPS